jgi:hypothetical protein
MLLLTARDLFRSPAGGHIDRRPPVSIPNSAPRRRYEATLVERMTFLVGRHATFGRGPPTYFRSTTAAR